MPRVAPFSALVYDDVVAGPIDLLTAPPYDVIDERRRRTYLDGSPFSIVHLDLAEGRDDPSVPGNRYEHAAGLLRAWRDDGVVRRLSPAYFAYEMTWVDPGGQSRRVRGVQCAMTLEPWGGAVLPHEHVMPGPVRDRLRLLRATRTHLSPVYGTVAGPHAPLAAALDEAATTVPLFETTDREAVTHRLWRVDPNVPLGEWLADDHLLIADGHHRYTTALAYRDERRAEGGAGAADRVLTFLVDAGAEHLRVLPYHRIQMAGAAPAPEEVVGDLPTLLGRLDDEVGTVGVLLAGDPPTYAVLHVGSTAAPTVVGLHHAWLDDQVPEEDLRFTHEADEAEDAVRNGGARAAYLLPPTTPERILEVVERGERLPRKSTFFWPKPRTGMVLMPLDDDA